MLPAFGKVMFGVALLVLAVLVGVVLLLLLVLGVARPITDAGAGQAAQVFEQKITEEEE